MSKITKWQRAILLAMYMLSVRAKHPLRVWIPRRALEHLVWFDWQASYTAKMDLLVEYGWIEQGRSDDGLIVYKLTPAGHGQLAIDMGMALANVRYDPSDELELF